MRRLDRFRRPAFLATLLLSPVLSLMGCFGFGPSDPSPGLQPAFIDVSSGNDQSGAARARLRDDVVAVVRLETGGPSPGDVAPNAQVEWRVTGGGGMVDPPVSTTDANGLARAAWTLGTEPGQQKLVARILGFVSVYMPEAEFTATAIPVDGFSGAGGATGAGDNLGTGGMTGAGGSTAPGVGGFNGGGVDGPRTGSGGAGVGGMTGAGGAGGPGPTCAARCIRDGAFCQCSVIATTDCPQLFQVACPSGAAASCTCRINGAVTASFPGTAVCDPTLLNAATACGFSVVIPN